MRWTQEREREEPVISVDQAAQATADGLDRTGLSEGEGRPGMRAEDRATATPARPRAEHGGGRRRTPRLLPASPGKGVTSAKGRRERWGVSKL